MKGIVSEVVNRQQLELGRLTTENADLRRQVEEARKDVMRESDYAEEERSRIAADAGVPLGIGLRNWVRGLRAALSRIAQSLGLPDADPERVAGEVAKLRNALLDAGPCLVVYLDTHREAVQGRMAFRFYQGLLGTIPMKGGE